MKAEGDLAVAEHELFLPPNKMVREAVCFHAQQAVEKFLKAVLASHGVSIKKTHNIALLLAECSDLDRDFFQIDLGELQSYAVDVRYPEFPSIIKIQETRDAFSTAKTIRDLVRAKLGITESNLEDWKEELAED